jgi:hypothetical protein
MRTLLLAVACLAVALPATAAIADNGRGTSFTVGGSSFHGGFGGRDGRRHRGNDDGVVFYDNYRDYQGDTAWKSDSFNDWWHDRPDRAYPAWVRNNQNCDRQWWGGNTLRC